MKEISIDQVYMMVDLEIENLQKIIHLISIGNYIYKRWMLVSKVPVTYMKFFRSKTLQLILTCS
jgi:hypothetical protein